MDEQKKYIIGIAASIGLAGIGLYLLLKSAGEEEGEPPENQVPGEYNFSLRLAGYDALVSSHGADRWTVEWPGFSNETPLALNQRYVSPDDIGNQYVTIRVWGESDYIPVYQLTLDQVVSEGYEYEYNIQTMYLTEL